MRKKTVRLLLLLAAVFTAPSALQAQEPAPPLAQMPRTLRWGLQRPDLMRFNRVEGLSMGVRGQVRPQTSLGPLSVTGTARIGIADLEPNGRVDITRETLKRRVTFSLFHELAAIDEDARHLGLGNSLLAAFAGRDDGDYYRRSGASFEWTPPELERRDFKVRGFAEYHRPVVVETDFAVFKLRDDAFRFRENLIADEGWVYGGQVAITPWWGSDPSLVQGGLKLTAEAATGHFEYARTALLARLAVPLPSDMRLGLEAGAGKGWGKLTTQRMWHLGGPSSLRGYDPRSLTGTSFVSARGELARTYSFASVSLFSDVGWVGESESYRFEDALYSAGVGLSVLDGLIRLDSAWGLRPPRAFRLELYLDAIH
ncbi:MAG: BamA/TamA family outer membrane protein [Gemmatimonadetes bacterium]|nr:BamA/TamA family outer membrane protein [Gemmatimonadota bacterium]